MRAAPNQKPGLLLTVNPSLEAQVLSPAALTMQPLSRWPEPMRLARGRESVMGTQSTPPKKADSFPG